MPPHAQGGELKRLHTSEDGLVWFGNDSRLAVNSYLPPDDFLEHLDQFGIDLFSLRSAQILGTRNNAALIVRLYNHQLRYPDQKLKIFVGNPLLGCSDTLDGDPAAALQRMWQSSASGAWRLVSERDFTNYSLIQALIDSDGRVNDLVKQLLHYHPAWPALSFVRNVDLEQACALISTIVDPRWFRHTSRPGRSNRLYVYLGLTPQNIKALVDRGSPGHHCDRARLALFAWYQRGRCDPRSFPWRIVRRYDDPLKGLLRATQRFVRFIQIVWLRGIELPHPELEFRPADFFKDDGEGAEFLRHWGHFSTSQ